MTNSSFIIQVYRYALRLSEGEAQYGPTETIHSFPWVIFFGIWKKIFRLRVVEMK